MRASHHVFEVAPHAVLAAGLAALLLAAPPVARADALDTILDLVLQSIDPSLLDAKQLLKCAIGQGGLNEKALQVCGGGVAKAQADAYLASDSTAQTVVAAGVAASKRQWGKVVEIGGSRLILDLACTAAMPPGPVKSVLCSSISGELSKLAKPVLGGVVGALSSSPPDALKLVSILGPGLACKVDFAIPAAIREAACGTIGELLAAGKDLAEGLAELANVAVKAAGYVFEAGDKVLGSYHEKQPPKAYFKTYWAYTTHLGAWLKYIKGDAALAAYVNEKHASCKQYYGTAKPCDAMRKVYLDTVNPAVAQLDGAAAAYFEVALKPNLLYHYLFYRSAGGKSPGFNWGGNACHLMEKFPLLEGDGLQQTQPRPTVWDHACRKAQELLLVELAQKKTALEGQLALLAKQGCTATSSASFHCVSYEGQAVCLKALPTHANHCAVDIVKANAALAPKISQQLGKRCSVLGAGLAAIQCTRPWKVDQCKSTAAAYHAQKTAPWGGKFSLACTSLNDPAFETGKLKAIEIAGALNHKAGGAAVMATAASETGAGCKPVWDPLSLGCKDHKAVAAQLAQLPALAVKYCAPDPNKDGADLPCIVPVLSADSVAATSAHPQPVAPALGAAAAARSTLPSATQAPAQTGQAVLAGGSAVAPAASGPVAQAARPAAAPPQDLKVDRQGRDGGRGTTLSLPAEPSTGSPSTATVTPTQRLPSPGQTGALPPSVQSTLPAVQSPAGPARGPTSTLPAVQMPVTRTQLPAAQPPAVQTQLPAVQAPASPTGRAPAPSAAPNWGALGGAAGASPPQSAVTVPSPLAGNPAAASAAAVAHGELAAVSCSAGAGGLRFSCTTRAGFDRCEALRRERKVEQCTLNERR